MAKATEKNGDTDMRQLVARMAPEFKKVLPAHVTPERFIRTVQTAIALNPNIRQADAQSVLAECTKAAADGLILDGREAALVPNFDGTVTYMPMIRGIRKLADQTGVVQSWVDRVVYTADTFRYILGDREEIIHEPHLGPDHGDPIAAYAIVRLMNGGIMREVMTEQEINAIRDRSKAYRAYVAKKIKSTPWVDDWAEMARKTVSRRISKSLPRSPERLEDQERFERAVERDDADYPAIEHVALPPAKEPNGAAKRLKTIEPKKKEEQDLDQDIPDYIEGEDIDNETGEVIPARQIER